MCNIGEAFDCMVFTVQSFRLGAVKEVFRSRGNWAGEALLKRNFEEAVRTRLGRFANAVLQPQRLCELMDQFQRKVMFRYDAWDSDKEGVFFVLPGIRQIQEVNVGMGYLSMTRSSCS